MSCSLVAAACPAHSHYEVCADTCGGTCASFISPLTCPESCFEGCQCDDGFVSDGVQCVRLENCGCVHNGKYLTVKYLTLFSELSQLTVNHKTNILKTAIFYSF